MKLKKFFKENYKEILINIAIYIIMAILIFPIIFNRDIGNLDELWNYNFARNIADGLIPYKDFNMIQTPLLPLIAGGILKIFSNELIVMRVLAVLLNAGIFFMVYKILSKLEVSKKMIIAFLLVWLNIIKDYLMLEYNYAVLLVTLIIVYIEIFNRKKEILESNLRKDIIVGILAGLAILFKQSIGIIICIVSVFYKIVLIRNKTQIKEFFKIAILRIISSVIPIIIILFYLGINGALSDFIDYAILGISTFSNEVTYMSLINSDVISIKILSILIPVVIITLYVFTAVKGKKILNSLVAYSIGMFAVTFPISDALHFFIGSTIGMVTLVYTLNRVYILFKNKFNLNLKGKLYKLVIYLKIFINTFIELMLIVSIFLCILDSILYFSEYKTKAQYYTSLNHFKYIKVSEGKLRMIQNIQNYIVLNGDNKVYILDSDAALYMIPLNIYNKDFDMFLKGNLGSKGEDGQILKIQNMEKHTKILIKNDKYNRNWQNPNKVTQYIKDNLEKIGEIEYFDIYVK